MLKRFFIQGEDSTSFGGVLPQCFAETVRDLIISVKCNRDSAVAKLYSLQFDMVKFKYILHGDKRTNPTIGLDNWETQYVVSDVAEYYGLTLK